MDLQVTYGYFSNSEVDYNNFIALEDYPDHFWLKN